MKVEESKKEIISIIKFGNFIYYHKKYIKLTGVFSPPNGMEWYLHSQGEKWMIEEQVHHISPRKWKYHSFLLKEMKMSLPL